MKQRWLMFYDSHDFLDDPALTRHTRFLVPATGLGHHCLLNMSIATGMDILAHAPEQEITCRYG
jgi:hypothetical protein